MDSGQGFFSAQPPICHEASHLHLFGGGDDHHPVKPTFRPRLDEEGEFHYAYGDSLCPEFSQPFLDRDDQRRMNDGLESPAQSFITKDYLSQ